MATPAHEARQMMAGHTIWLWHYLHADWQWEQSRHWHEDRYALAVKDVLATMREHKDFTYYFDTASEFYSAVEDRLTPAEMAELREHIRNGRIRLVSGQVSNPRPTQVGEETYIRNLQLGKEYWDKRFPQTDLSLFHSVDIAIGHVQMPQILNLAHFKYYKAWRPHGPMNALGIPHQFHWEGIDGSRIMVSRGIYGALFRPEDTIINEHATRDWDEVFSHVFEEILYDQVVRGRSPSKQLWMIQGSDDSLPLYAGIGDHRLDLFGFIETWRNQEDVPIRWCTPVEYLQAVAEHADKLPIVQGVLDGADVSYNAANGGSHGLWWWRKHNDLRLLDAERWATVAASSGFVAPWQELKSLWYQHCIYQAHAQEFAFLDDWNYLIGLATDVKRRAALIEQNALAAIVQAAGGGERTTRYLFNPHPWPVETDVEVYHPLAEAGYHTLEIVDDDGNVLPQQSLLEFRHPRFVDSLNDERRLVRVTLPPLGYKRIEIVEKKTKDGQKPASPANDVLETADLKLVFRGNTLREVHDRRTGRVYSSQEGDAWPNLYYHVLDRQDWVMAGPELRRDAFQPNTSEWLQTGPLRWHHRSVGSVGPYQAQLDVIVPDQGREIQVKVRLEGHWKLPPETGFVTLLGAIDAGGEMTVDAPFAVEARDPDNDIYAHNVPPDEDLGQVGMFERSLPGLFWGRSWADWSGEGQGVTLITTDGCFYWLKEADRFGHFVLRAIDNKPGTWEEFCHPFITGTGVHEFTYTYRFHNGDWRQADPQRRAQELRHPVQVVRANHVSDAKLTANSFLSIEGPALLSAYYREGDATFVRFYEHEGTGGQVTLTLDWKPTSAEMVDLRGQGLGQSVQVHGQAVIVDVKPWQIVTLQLLRSG